MSTAFRRGLLLLLLVASLLLLRLGAVPLLGPDEPRYTRVAVEMQRAASWVRPTLQGEPWLEKPPLYYWLAGGAFRFLGETETAARLPSLAALLLLTGATALWGARLYGSAAGLHAGFVAGTSLLPFAYGRAASMDMLLAAFVTVAIGFYALRLVGIAGRTAVVAGAAAAGVATLAKGPLGLLLPGLVVGGFLLSTREWRRLRELFAPLAILAFLVVAAPWYVAIFRDQGERFVSVFLLNHNLQRFSSTIHNHPGPFWYYLPVLLVGLFPWSGLAIPGLVRTSPRESLTDRFVLLWLVLPLAFFSLAASKLPGYILPCVPPLAILMGRAADRLVTEAATPRATRPGHSRGLVGLVLARSWPQRRPRSSASRSHLALALIPLAVWAPVVTFLVPEPPPDRPRGLRCALAGQRRGAPALIALAAPPILARRESGRVLFIPAMGRSAGLGVWRRGMDGEATLQRRARRRSRTRARVMAAVRAGSPARPSGTRRTAPPRGDGAAGAKARERTARHLARARRRRGATQ
jgi:4-amino-4-deoxy-L-arabinose transferase-like glycosyltransferase